MTNRCSLHVLATVIIVAFAGSVSIHESAAAEQRPPVRSQALSELELKITGNAVSSATPRARQLNCHPAGGDHPYRTLACRDLDAAHGDLNQLPGDPGKPCNGLYSPVTATALGEWQGTPIRFQRAYRNLCNLRASTGPVFQF